MTNIGNGSQVPSFVYEALAQRMLYYNSESFNPAKQLVAEYHKVDGSTLDGMVNKFLMDRKISPDAEKEILLQMQEPEVKLLGYSHYFARKFFTTTHDLPNSPNPIPLINNVFDCLYVTGNEKAAKFLRELAELSSKDPNNQQRIVRITGDMVPYIMTKHREALEKVKSSRKEGTTAYNTEISAANKAHNLMVDRVIEYSHDVITYQRRPSIKPFMNFLGITA